MKNNKKDSLTGLTLIIIGSCICLTVGWHFLTSIFAIACGLFLINYGLRLRNQPSVGAIAQRIINDLHIRFF